MSVTPQAKPKRTTRLVMLRLLLIIGVSITGALILWQLQSHPVEPTSILVARVLGSATPSIIFGIIPTLLIRNWYGFTAGVFVIGLMDYFAAVAILHNQSVH